MKPVAMAALYARAFPDRRAWSVGEITDLIESPGGFAVSAASGFAIGRAVADEAELVTIAVDPDARRRGFGQALLAEFETEARAQGADTVFLEVAADNAPACALYRSAGWAETGRRRGYYARATGAVDALTMAKPLAAGRWREP